MLVPEIGLEGQLKLLDAKVLLLGAGGLGSPTGPLPRRRRRRHDRPRRRRRRRRLQPAAPGDPQHRADRDAEDRVRADRDRGAEPRRQGDRAQRPARPRQRDRAALATTTSSSTAPTTSRPATCSTTPRCGSTSRSSRPRSSPSTGRSRPSSRSRAPATAASTRPRLRPSSRRAAAPPACSACCRGSWACCRRSRWSSSSPAPGQPLIGRLLLFEALGTEFTELKVRRDPDCPICGPNAPEVADEDLGKFPDYELFCAG